MRCIVVTVSADMECRSDRVFAIKVIGLCEIAPAPRRFLKQNVPCEAFWGNIMERCHRNPVPRPRSAVVWYSAGFPCKAFSSLRIDGERALCVAVVAFICVLVVTIMVVHVTLS